MSLSKRYLDAVQSKERNCFVDGDGYSHLRLCQNTMKVMLNDYESILVRGETLCLPRPLACTLEKISVEDRPSKTVLLKWVRAYHDEQIRLDKKFYSNYIKKKNARCLINEQKADNADC